MRKTFSALIFLMVFTSSAFTQVDSYFDIVENKGQWPQSVRYATDVEHGKIFLEKNKFTFHFYDLSPIAAIHNGGKVPVPGEKRFSGHVFQQQFLNTNEAVRHTAAGIQKAYYNFFLGNNQEQWAGRCRAYSDVNYQALYNGINLHYYVEDFSLKYDWIVFPGADPSIIQWKYEGVEEPIIEDGRLKISSSVFTYYEQAPIAYQFIEGSKVLVPCEFRLSNGVVQFKFPKGYDKQHTLIIDPVLVFSTYSGSFADNFGYTATYDSEGNLFSGSSAFGQGYPTTVGAYQVTWAGGDGGGLPGTDMAISKYDESGSFMHWSTFIGGPNDELPHSLICNSNDEVVVYGTTSSPSYPTTTGAFDTVFSGGAAFAPQGVGTDYVNGSDIVVTILSQDGSDLEASTFIGGSANDGVNTAAALKFNYADEFRGEVDLDNDGNILIASSTYSTNFPIVNGAQNILGGNLDACVIKLQPDLSDIIWSSFFGGPGFESGNSVSVNDDNEVYLCGGTTSITYNMPAGAYQSSYQGGSADGFIAKWNEAGSSLLDATFLGANEYDQLYFVEVDSENNVVVYGQTLANGSTFVINAGWSEPNSGMLVTKMNGDLSQLIWSTVFGTGEDKCNLSPAAFTVDVCDKIYLSGWGGTTNTSTNTNTDTTTGMTTTSDAYQSSTNGGDFYLLVIESDASDLVYASFFGGLTSQEHVDGGTSRFDRRGIIYQSVCAGCGSNDDFPIFPMGGVVSATNNSFNCNNGVFKFNFELPLTIADFQVPPTACVNQPISVINNSQLGQSFEWDFGGLFSSSLFQPTYTFSSPGTYEIELVVLNPQTCNLQDTIRKTIEIIEPSTSTLEDVVSCNDEFVEIGPDNVIPGDTYQWIPSLYLSDANDPNPIFSPGESTNYTLLIQHGACVDTLFQDVIVSDISIALPDDLVLCDGGIQVINASVSDVNANITWSLSPNPNIPVLEGVGELVFNPNILQPTTVYVTADVNGCEASDEMEINIVSFQTEIEGDFTACVGDTVELAIVNPNNSFTYNWSPEDLIISGQNTSQVEVVVNETTTFTVVSNTPEGCTATDDVTVDVSELQSMSINATGSPTTIVVGQTVQLNVEPSGYTYSWGPVEFVSDSNIPNPTATPTESTTYYVTISDGECSATDSLRITVLDFVCGPPSIYVPNAFTPNSDSRNEKLFVRALNVTKINFVIYDRWGEKVFETNSQYIGWDGYFRDKLVDPAVFVYYLEATCEGGATYFEKGNITVIR